MRRFARIAVACFVLVCVGTIGFLIGRVLPADGDVARLTLTGPHSADIAVRRADGSAAVGETWALRFLSDRNVHAMGITYGDPPRTRQIQPAGASMDLILASGVVPDNGVISLRGLPGGEHTQILHLFVGDGGYLGFSLPDDAKLHESLTLELPVHLQANSAAPSMEVVRVRDDARISLPTKGQVTYLEFWGVHCGPCQKPLAELNALAKRRSDWQGKVQLASICLDSLSDVRRHVAEKRLENLDHFTTMTNPTSGQPNAYGVQGVPMAFLVDAQGQIVWSGHPDGFDVETQIDSLLGPQP